MEAACDAVEDEKFMSAITSGTDGVKVIPGYGYARLMAQVTESCRAPACLIACLNALPECPA
jgi:hypothetical protein